MLYTLIHTATGKPAIVGETVTCFRGESHRLLGGTPPHKPSSTGRAYVEDSEGHKGEYYPSVFGLKWAENPTISKGE